MSFDEKKRVGADKDSEMEERRRQVGREITSSLMKKFFILFI